MEKSVYRSRKESVILDIFLFLGGMLVLMFLVVIGRSYYDGNGHNLWGYTIIIIYTYFIFLKIYTKKKVIAIFYENTVCLPFEEIEREVLFEEIQEVKMTSTLQLNLKEGEIIFLPKNEQNDDIYWGLKRILKENKK